MREAIEFYQHKHDVKGGKDEDLTGGPNQMKAVEDPISVHRVTRT